MHRLLAHLILACNISANAATIHTFTPSQLLQAREVLTRYFEREETAYAVRRLRESDLEGISAALIVLDLAEPNLEDRSSSMQNRIYSALKLIPAVLTAESVGQEERELLHQKLTPFLQRYRASGRTQGLIIQIYNRFDLWTAEDFWFLRPKASERWLHRTLVRIGPTLSAGQRAELNETLNKIRPYQLNALLLQYQLGLLQPQQLVILLKKMAAIYQPISEEHYWDIAASVQRISQEMDYYTHGRQDSVPVLESLQLAYNRNDPAVLKAVEKAAQSAKTAPALRFFELLKSDGFSQMQLRYPDIWSAWKAAESESDPLGLSEAAPKPSRPKVIQSEGNVVKIDFSRDSSCEDDLK